MTPAEELRPAAKLMRERVQGATAGPWTVREEHGRDIADVAGMSPAVALAVAAWLEQEAVNADAFAGHGHMLAAPSPHALTVARAYLADQIEALAEVAGTFTKEG